MHYNSPGAVDDDEFEPSPETLLSLRKLELLSAEGAKLKQMKVLNCIPQDRLVRLLNILDRHIRDSVQLTLNPEPVWKLCIMGRGWLHTSNFQYY